jgi:hypothetical protein
MVRYRVLFVIIRPRVRILFAAPFSPYRECLVYIVGVWPSGKASGFDPAIPGSIPGTPAIFLI